MNIRAQVLLWTAQRISAAVLALCVLVHLVTMIYAVKQAHVRMQEVVDDMTHQQIQEAVIEAVIGMRATAVAKQVRVEAASGEYDSEQGYYVEHGLQIKMLGFALPVNLFVDKHEEFVKEYDAETEQRDSAQKKVADLATRCRDRAMLGDGTQALAAFDDFVRELRGAIR